MNLPCGIILDLIPLVKDGVASRESISAVKEHLSYCESCRCEFESFPPIPHAAIDDKKVITKIKKSLLRLGILILCAGSLIGIFMTNSMNVFYNILIMPAVGILGYIFLKRRWVYVPVSILFFSYMWILLSSCLDSGFDKNALIYSIPYAIIYMLLTATGTVIAALLKFAFGKEKE